jgi:hypothetical protein
LADNTSAETKPYESFEKYYDGNVVQTLVNKRLKPIEDEMLEKFGELRFDRIRT